MMSNIPDRYATLIKHKILLIAGLMTALVGLAVFSMHVGAYPLSVAQIISGITGHGEPAVRHIIIGIRLPRIIAALVAGACLAIAGTAMQNVLKNPLASPFTLGISQGAAFGAAFAIIFLGAGNIFVAGSGLMSIRASFLIVSCAFLGSMVTVIVLVGLATLREMSPAAIILAGVALGSFFGAATMLLQYFASDIQVASSIFWTFGDIGKAQWNHILIMSVMLSIAGILFAARGWHFNAILWGDDSAKSMGVNVTALRLVSLVMASLLTALVTAFLGIIGFVGLIAPHMMRMLIGQDHRYLFPCTALFGALLLLAADLLARTVMAPVILPVGILTSFAGVPMFLYLLIKRRGIGL